MRKMRDESKCRGHGAPSFVKTTEDMAGSMEVDKVPKKHGFFEDPRIKDSGFIKFY